MANIVLGIGTSHSPVLSTRDHNEWAVFAQGDYRHRELVDPRGAVNVTYEELEGRAPAAVKAKAPTEDIFREQYAACQRALGELAKAVRDAEPDVTVIISDDQDELFFEDIMPAFAVYWGESIPIIPMDPDKLGLPPNFAAIGEALLRGYGDQRLDVPVASALGRHIIEYLTQHDFDVAHSTYLRESYGGRIARRYPTPDGESAYVKETPPHPQGLPHGYAFIVQRLFEKQPRTILPLFQNTCYPPNQPTARRSFQFGQAVAKAIESWERNARVAIVASGGLSHFVVDEDLDRTVLDALARKDAKQLTSAPRERLYSAASETQNWIALGGAMQETDLQMELIEYVPMYRTAAGTGGGWGFARWR